jgi:GT2 family glycosyltransferase
MGESPTLATDAVPVYLVHYGAPDWARSATDSLLLSDISVSIAVVNNSPEPLLDLDPRVRVITSGRNAGFAGGANIGIREWLGGDHPYCLVGSHDLHVERDTIRRLVEAADLRPEAGILGPHLTTNAVGEPLGHEYGLDLRTMISGACLLLRRECVQQIGAFDELFGSYGEDDEICARARRRGWLVGRVTDARARGLGSRTPNREHHRYPNLVLLQYRNQGLAAAVRVIAGHARMAVVSLIRGDWSEATNRAHGVIAGTRKLVRARRGAQTTVGSSEVTSIRP